MRNIRFDFHSLSSLRVRLDSVNQNRRMDHLLSSAPFVSMSGRVAHAGRHLDVRGDVGAFLGVKQLLRRGHVLQIQRVGGGGVASKLIRPRTTQKSPQHNYVQLQNRSSSCGEAGHTVTLVYITGRDASRNHTPRSTALLFHRKIPGLMQLSRVVLHMAETTGSKIRNHLWRT